MSEQERLPEYRQGDTVRLTVELRDEQHGVREALTTAFLEGSGERDKEPALWNSRRTLDLGGSVEEATTRAEIAIQGTVWLQDPGVYACYAVVGVNSRGVPSRHELDPPRRFRIVEHSDDVREGPEILSVGEIW